ncbi:MAG: hypothetical protein JW995_12000 [Melioribacteraceae bacterium]|nr:hypothetical protein [Melioribacteraceae bacterium]
MRKIIKLVAILIVPIVLYTCADTPITESEKNNSQDEVSLSKKDWKLLHGKDAKTIPPGFIVDSSVIGTRDYECGVKYVTGYVFEHFAQIPNKYIGVSAPSNSNPSWKELHDTYGFTQIVVDNSTERNYAINVAGFNQDSLMTGIGDPSAASAIIQDLDNIPYYYLNEPLEKGTFTVDQILDVSEMLYSHNYGAKLFVISFKWPTYLFYGIQYSEAINPANTFIMCDQYQEKVDPLDPSTWDEYHDLFGDSRDYWYMYEDFYGQSNIFTHWMEINRSVGQFRDLFGYASNHNMNTLWLYAGGDTNPNPEKFKYFCFIAWQKGWLRGFAQNYQIVYRCQLPDPCDCDPNSDEFWYVDKIYVYPYIYERFPQ